MPRYWLLMFVIPAILTLFLVWMVNSVFAYAFGSTFNSTFVRGLHG